MNLPKLPYSPSAAIDFFQEALEKHGAVCERSWHDKLQVLAEGRSAQLWDPDGGILETEIHFPPPDSIAPREAASQVFPGSPLLFKITEALRSSPLLLQRVCLTPDGVAKPPALDVAEKLWHNQFPGGGRWKLDSPLLSACHHSLLVLVRCEIQAIDQHWSLHRLVLSLPDGARDPMLEESLQLIPTSSQPLHALSWPKPDPDAWAALIRSALEQEIAPQLKSVRLRQENFLARELKRIDEFFHNYEQELRERRERAKADAQTKWDDRLAAAKAEHARRRLDQVQRHEIRVIPQIDALLLIAEPAWKAKITVTGKQGTRTLHALFVPRARRWVVMEQNSR